MAPGPPSSSSSLMEQTCTNLKLTLSKSGGIPSEQLCCKFLNNLGKKSFKRFNCLLFSTLHEQLPFAFSFKVTTET